MRLYHKWRMKFLSVWGCWLLPPLQLASNGLQIGDCAENKEPKPMRQIQIKNNNTDLHNEGIATNLRVMFSLLLRGC